MSHQFNSRIILAILISVSIVACKGKDKDKEKEAATTDTTTTATTTTQPATNNDDMSDVKVAPNLYKSLADSAGIRVVEVNYKPGDSSAMHWHPDYAIYVAQGGSVTFYGKDGSKTESNLPTGATMIKPGEWHSAKNTGKNPIKVILFEVTRTGAVTAPDAAMDATKVAPKLYKTLADTMGIRILEINYKPGDMSAMHSHPDGALYVISPSTSEFTKKDGTKQTMNLPKGMAAIIPADTHSVKNVGKTATKAILVEVNRAMK